MTRCDSWSSDFGLAFFLSPLPRYARHNNSQNNLGSSAIATLIDLGHHNSEIPGLYYLKKIIEKLDIDCEVIDKNPINKLK